jgi:formylglycine-generating enzyme
MLAAASFSGCLVSFDGYELADAGGSDNATSGSGGSVSGSNAVSGSSGAGGRSSDAGASNGGAAGRAGTNAGASSGKGGADNGGGGATAGAATNGGGGATNGGASSGAGGAIAAGASNGGGGGVAGKANGGSGGASAGAGGSAGNPASCPPPLHGAILVEIARPDGGIFCIDRTEATNADYGQFLATNPSTTAQSAVCASNATFAPASDATNCTQYDPSPAGNGKAPISCVNWCDAQAFCAWAGKRLCGKIGGGSNLTSAFADATKSEWYTACSHAGQYAFPYGADGTSYEAKSCIGADYGSIRQSAVPTASCQGGYNGVFDMSGNVSEWEDSCAASAGLSDQCAYRGGSYADLDTGTTPTLLCNSGTATTPKLATKPRSTRDPEIGFRCCADP